MKSELQMRKVKTAFRALHASQRGKILSTLLQEAIQIGTPWTDEVNEHIGDAWGHGKWLGNYNIKDELEFEKNWLKRDQKNQQARL